MLRVYLYILRAHEIVSRETNFCVISVKIIDSVLQQTFSKAYFVSLNRSWKMQVFHETWHEHIKYEDTHADIFSDFLTP
jgi:hypothetical protein